jgi:uncharacterized protein YbgA (DUF1722 family)
MTIQFGAMAPDMREQLRDCVVCSDQRRAYLMKRLQRAADAVTLLAVQGFLNDSQKSSARKKIMKVIIKNFRTSDPPLAAGGGL